MATALVFSSIFLSEKRQSCEYYFPTHAQLKRKRPALLWHLHLEHTLFTLWGDPVCVHRFDEGLAVDRFIPFYPTPFYPLR